MGRLLVAAALILGLGVFAGVSSAQDPPEERPVIYKWIDENGIAHYTTDKSRIPRSLRRKSGPLRESTTTRQAPVIEPDPVVEDESPLLGSAEWQEDPPILEDPVAAPPAPAPAPAPRASTPRVPTSPHERDLLTDRPRRYEDEFGNEIEFAEQDGFDSGDPDETGDVPYISAAERAERLREIESQISVIEADIATNEETLRDFVATPAPENPAEVAYDPIFRQVAERLPSLLAELRTLEDERAELESY